jgi:hypothetical protein
LISCTDACCATATFASNPAIPTERRSFMTAHSISRAASPGAPPAWRSAAFFPEIRVRGPVRRTFLAVASSARRARPRRTT